MKRFFKLPENQTTVPRELAAGVTTFAAMAYILAVNPAILAVTGMDKGALVTVTAVTSAAATVLMALLSNYPLALAPGMGINAFFAFTVCLGLRVPWPEALGMVFVNGVIFLVLSATGVRERIIGAIPYSLKLAITCGIGLFIAFIGLKNGGVIVSDPATYVTHGDFSSPPVALCLAGIVLTAVLVIRRVPGAIVLTIATVTVAGLLIPDGAGGTITRRPGSLLSWPHSPAPLLLHLRFGFLGSWTRFRQAVPIILTLLLVDMFDNIGTLIGVTKRAGYLSPDGRLPRAGRALVADSVATILSSLMGTSTVTSYIESAAGVEAGGRTGLTTLATAACLLLSLVLTPLILAVPAVATAPALVAVGIFMMQSIAEIPMGDFREAAPAVLTILAIPLCFSIASGIGIGLVAAALIALGTGRARSFPAFGYAIAAVFLAQFLGIFPFGK